MLNRSSLKAKRLLYMAQRKLETGADFKEVEALTRSALQVLGSEEMGDPFAGSLDEFLAEKETQKKETPQEILEDKIDEESTMPVDQETSTQEDLNNKITEKSESIKEHTDTPQEAVEKKSAEEGVEADIEARIKKLAQSTAERGYPTLAKKILMAGEFGIIDTLNVLLQKEYLQRDLYESYDYLIFGTSSISIREHLREHLEDEMEHIKVLQRYIVSLGGTPTLQRLPVPEISPLSLESILQKDLELELDAVLSYTTQIKALENDVNYTSLRVDLENILVVETEHVHDLGQWLRTYQKALEINASKPPSVSKALIHISSRWLTPSINKEILDFTKKNMIKEVSTHGVLTGLTFEDDDKLRDFLTGIKINFKIRV